MGNIAVYNGGTESFTDFITMRGILANYRAIIQGNDKLYSSQINARLIRPDTTSQNYDFYLYGQKNQNDTSSIFGPVQITVQTEDNEESGFFEVSVPRGVWTLTLAAVNHGSPFTKDFIKQRTVTQKALLWGSCLADTQNISLESNFILSDTGLTTPGTINLPITLSDWNLPSGIQVEAGLYYTKSGKAVENSVSNISFTNSDGVFYGTYNPMHNGTSLEIPPGTYNFKIIFSDSTNPLLKGVWSDRLHVFPGKSVNTNLYIPRILNEIPEAPELFKISHFKTTRNDFISEDEKYYSCIFEWNDVTNKETGFAIRLTDVNPENGLTEDSGHDLLFTSQIETDKLHYISGSLDANSTKLEARLELGRSYKAEIRSVNAAGSSDWVLCSIKDSSIPYTEQKFSRLSEDSSSPLYNVINLYKVSYHFNGGRNSKTIELNNGIGSVETNKLKDTYTFYGPDNTYSSLSINNPEAIYISENGNSLYFDFWGLIPITTTQYSENPFDSSNHSNIDLWAQYKTISPVATSAQLSSLINDNMMVNETAINTAMQTEDSALSFSLGTNATWVLTNKISGENLFKYEYLSMTIKNANGRIIHIPYSAQNIDTYSESILTESKITITTEFTEAEGFTNGNYSILLEGRKENTSQIEQAVLYFKILP